MSFKTALLRSATVGAFIAFAAGAAHAETTPAAPAKTVKHHSRHVVRHAPAKVVEPAASAEEVRALKAEIEELKARLDSTAQAQQATAAQVAETQAKASEAAQNAAAAEDKVETIPEQVNVAVGQLPKPKTDKIYLGPVSLKFGGFIAAEGIYRSRAEGADIASSFNSIPFSGLGGAASLTTATGGSAATGNAASIGHTQELRFTARQSRVSGLAEADVDSNTHLAAYGEFDFQGGAQTANSNESNSYNPRIRNLYLTLDRSDLGLSILAGQSWSLATMTTKGLSPRSEDLPPSIDAQYVPGFVWTRQPQFRITDQLASNLWVGVSVENPQTTFSGTLPSAALRDFVTETAASGFANSNVLSLNHLPDVIGKVAFEPVVLDRKLHLEVFGIFDDFYNREAAGITATPGATPAAALTLTESATQNQNVDTYGGGVGFGVIVPVVPKFIDFQFSGLAGDGIGRYGAGQLPDVTYKYNGTLQPIHETLFLAGLTVHATPSIDVYAFGGQEQASKTYDIDGTTAYGYGTPLVNNTNCFGETSTTTTSCGAQTRTLEQLAFGFWDKVYNGPFGQFRVGVEYSYTERKAFLGIGGAPSTNDNMIFTSIRYYPFQ